MGIFQSLLMCLNKDASNVKYIKLLEDTIEEQKNIIDERDTDIKKLENILTAQNAYLSCSTSENGNRI